MNRSLHRPTTDALVWDTVLKTVGESSILKQEVKDRILGGKLAGENEISAVVQRELGRRKKLAQQLKRYEDIEADAEYNHLTGAMTKGAYTKVKARLQKDRLHIESEIEQSKLHQDNAQNKKRWMSWLNHHEASIDELRNYDDKQKRAYLRDVVEKIDVELTDDNKHQLHIKFRLPIVGDEFEMVDSNSKPRKTQIKEGSLSLLTEPVDLRGTGGSKQKTLNGLSASKKKDCED